MNIPKNREVVVEQTTYALPTGVTYNPMASMWQVSLNQFGHKRLFYFGAVEFGSLDQAFEAAVHYNAQARQAIAQDKPYRPKETRHEKRSIDGIVLDKGIYASWKEEATTRRLRLMAMVGCRETQYRKAKVIVVGTEGNYSHDRLLRCLKDIRQAHALLWKDYQVWRQQQTSAPVRRPPISQPALPV